MTSNQENLSALRPDLKIIADMVDHGVRLLDIGCDDGALLHHLRKTKQVDGRGIELSQKGVNACVAKGLTVVVLSQTLQATKNPRDVLQELLRISSRVIVSFPNFGNWRVRLSLLFGGRMPVTKSLNQPWYSTPNIHFCTIQDFIDLCTELNAKIDQAYSLSASDKVREIGHSEKLANLVGEQAIFLLSRKS
jgi:hypothetical protein